MVNIYFYLDNNEFAFRVSPAVPRVGEFVVLEDVVYEVFQVLWVDMNKGWVRIYIKATQT